MTSSMEVSDFGVSIAVAPLNSSVSIAIGNSDCLKNTQSTPGILSGHNTDLKPICGLTSRNPAVIKQRLSYLFQTVNHAKVVWDQKLKPRGLFGGHLNVRSVVSKTEQLTHLLLNSNLDYLCLSETWLQQSTPINVYSVPRYQCFRRNRAEGRGGGVLIYVKDNIKCERIIFKEAGTLEYVALKIILSRQMSFILIALYRPPSANETFYDQLTDMLKECNHNKELILMGDYNLNWEDKGKRRKLKTITDKYNLQQLIRGPTRITKNSSTVLDL